MNRASLTGGEDMAYIMGSRLTWKAGVAELADARDSKSRGAYTSCGFDPHLRHHRRLI